MLNIFIFKIFCTNLLNILIHKKYRIIILHHFIYFEYFEESD